MTITASPEVRPNTSGYQLDEVDKAAGLAAIKYCEKNRERILDDPVKELTGLFDQMTENYPQRQLHYRVDYGDEVIHVMQFGTRTPDRSRIDEIFSEFTIYQNSPRQKQLHEATQRSITILGEGDSFQRLIIEDGELVIVNQAGRTIDAAKADDVVMDAVGRAHKAVGTYNKRSFEDQTEADWDALAKLQELKQITG